MPLSDPLTAAAAVRLPNAGGSQQSAPPASKPLRWAKALALGYIAVFAALLASFTARNSDLWMHLVRGRQLVHAKAGESGLDVLSGSRPYPGWLYDVACYGAYTALGGGGLVVAKVLLVVALALVMWRLSRPRANVWIAAGCTALALLAMSTRLQVQPATVSYLFLAFTLYFLGPDPAPLGRLRAVMVASLFLLWAGMDRGFVIGLGVVALLWFGQVLDSRDRRPIRAARLALPLTFAFLLVAWYLLGVRSYLIPPEVASVASPLQPPHLVSLARSPAGLAYFALLVLGAVAFRANRANWSWQQILPWLGLALLSIVNIRAIPWFAVVAGPALAWNLHGLTASDRPARRFVVALLTLPAALGLLVCAWPGWLQAPPLEPRSWQVSLPAGPERAAAELRRWRAQNKLKPEQRTLHLSPETAYAFAWYNPRQRGMLDDRFASAVDDGVALPAAWLEQLRTAHIDHVVVHDADRERLLVVLERLLRDPGQWPLLYLEGDVAIFGWRDPATRHSGLPEAFAGRELDLNRLAFDAQRNNLARRKHNDQPAEKRSWWQMLWKSAATPSLDHDKAVLCLLHAEALQRSAPYRRLRAWEASQSAALIAAFAGWGVPQVPIDVTVHLALVQPPVPEKGRELPSLGRMVVAWQQGFTVTYEEVPPAVLFLAIRSARRALAVNPGDAQAYLVLGESYLRLLYGTRERLWGRRLPELVQLRRTQASAALNRAVALDPNLAQAHFSLGRLYQDIGYLDLALDHLRTYQQLLRPSRSSAGHDPAAEGLAQAVAKLSDNVAERQAAYDVEADNLRVLDRALTAYDKYGLAARARDLLLESDVSAFGPKGLRLELELLLRTGRSRDVVEWTSPEQKAVMGGATYHWLRVQALAAAGDYALAAEECDRLADDARGGEPLQPWQIMSLLVGQAVLDEQPVGATVGDLAWRSMTRLKMYNRTLSLAKDLRQVANARVFRGLLALEEGNMEEAEVAFRLALAFWQDDEAAASGAGLDFNARPVAEAALDWLR